MFKILNFVFLVFIFSISILYSQNDNSSIEELEENNTNSSIIEKMENYSEKKKTNSSYNPFRTTEIERRMVGWQDPNANITRFWIGSVLTAKNMYANENFLVDNIMLYMTPTIASEFALIPFKIADFKFFVGIGFMLDFNMSVYQNHIPRHGVNSIFSDHMQVEVYIDMIIKEAWKIRFIPLRHRCDHIAGDWYGDPALYNAYSDDYCDTGYENIALQVFNIFGWFTFYGGLEGNINSIIPAIPSTFATVFAAHIGTDVRIPIWREISFIAGFYIAANYREYNEKYKTIDEYSLLSYEAIITDTYHKWHPNISIGLGIEIDRYTIGLKYLRKQSEQLHSHKQIEEKLGAEVTFIF